MPLDVDSKAEAGAGSASEVPADRARELASQSDAMSGRLQVHEPALGGEVVVDLTGQLFAVNTDGSVLLLDLPGLGACLALFAGLEELRDYLRRIGISDYRIKQVTDGIGFIQSGNPCPVVCNMRFDSTLNKSKWILVRPTETA